MAELSIETIQPIIDNFNKLAACVSDIEGVTSFLYAEQKIDIPAGDVTQAKIDTNALLATLKTDVAALTDIL